MHSDGAHAQATDDQVLVVEDEPLVRHFAARVLEEGGYRVHEAADGAEALAFVRAQAAYIRAVVSDILMPRMNGVELLHALSIDYPELPVLLMSGYGAAQLADRGIAMPCGVLAKPLSPQLLLEEVNRCVRGKG